MLGKLRGRQIKVESAEMVFSIVSEIVRSRTIGPVPWLVGIVELRDHRCKVNQTSLDHARSAHWSTLGKANVYWLASVEIEKHKGRMAAAKVDMSSIKASKGGHVQHQVQQKST